MAAKKTQSRRKASTSAPSASQTQSMAGSNTGLPGNQARADIAQNTAEVTAERIKQAEATGRGVRAKKSDVSLTGPFLEGEEVGIYEEAQVVANGKLQGEPKAKAKASKVGEIKASGLVLGSYTAVGSKSGNRVNFAAKK